MKIIWWKIDPGAIGFTRGFPQDSKFYGGRTNYCRAIDRKVHSYENIQA